jgi:adenylate kinase family enzyme
MTPQTYVFFGRSGCGKGTQVELLMKFLKEKDPATPQLYIQTGEKGRDFAKQDNLTARMVRDTIANGQLFPSFIPIYFWTQVFVESIQDGNEHIFLDGLCRRPEESPILDDALQFYKREKPTIISINVSEKWATERLLARQRADDIPRDIANRLDWYEKQVVPAVDYFRKHPGFTVLDINGEQTIAEVQAELLLKLGLAG